MDVDPRPLRDRIVRVSVKLLYPPEPGIPKVDGFFMPRSDERTKPHPVQPRPGWRRMTPQGEGESPEQTS